MNQIQELQKIHDSIDPCSASQIEVSILQAWETQLLVIAQEMGIESCLSQKITYVAAVPLFCYRRVGKLQAQNLVWLRKQIEEVIREIG